ncbi:MAG: stage II sporulation protein P [Clostridia bacterium]|nr:stage II sporulation protein P [Clostridia bacterium]
MNFKNILTVCLVMAAALYTSADTTYKYINYKFPTLSDEIIATVKNEKIYNAPEQLETVLPPIDNDTQKEENESETAVTVATPESAVGKITDRFISPYGANTSYNKVYLKNNSGAKIDLPALLKQNISFKIQTNSTPQVLIMHTHTTESYMTEKRDYYVAEDVTRRTDTDKNMAYIGDIFVKNLEAAGIGVIHDKTLHDHPSYTGSYTRSAETIKKHLKENPSIKIVIDIHRDAITSSDKTKSRPIVEIGGKRMAQVMLVMGSETGGITNFPNWKQNLSLAVKYQQTMEVMYPGLARAITLNSAKYNQNLTVGSLLLEVGSEANTFDEAAAAAEAASAALVSLLNTQK